MLSDDSLDILFHNARSHNGWLDQNVSREQVQQIYALMKLAPTAANTCPARIIFVHSKQAKQRLKPHLDAGNIDKAMSAPMVAIIGYDMEFYEKLPYLFPHTDARSWYVGEQKKIKQTAQMNATLQGAYFIMATRSVGLDCGPMGGFNNQTLDNEFFPDDKIKSIFICGIGYGDKEKLFLRSPRLSFDETCEIV